MLHVLLLSFGMLCLHCISIALTLCLGLHLGFGLLEKFFKKEISKKTLQ